MKSKHLKYSEIFRLAPGERVRIKDLSTHFADRHEAKSTALREVEKLRQRMDELQFQLYAEQQRSLLICLQALDAGGKDGVVRHVIGSMNPQGCRVVGFKQPTPEELSHDFLWRIEHQTPKRGEVAVFNRSHYEDVLIARVHHLVPKGVWSERYRQINDFERRLVANGTHILKFFLHISQEEQLKRFRQRLDDPARRWKISEADYSEREYWGKYEVAYEDALRKCGTQDAPWYAIPSDNKWFRDLVISQIIVATLEKLHLQVPEPTVNVAEIRRKYHHAVAEGKEED